MRCGSMAASAAALLYVLGQLVAIAVAVEGIVVSAEEQAQQCDDHEEEELGEVAAVSMLHIAAELTTRRPRASGPPAGEAAGGGRGGSEHGAGDKSAVRGVLQSSHTGLLEEEVANVRDLLVKAGGDPLMAAASVTAGALAGVAQATAAPTASTAAAGQATRSREQSPPPPPSPPLDGAMRHEDRATTAGVPMPMQTEPDDAPLSLQTNITVSHSWIHGAGLHPWLSAILWPPHRRHGRMAENRWLQVAEASKPIMILIVLLVMLSCGLIQRRAKAKGPVRYRRRSQGRQAWHDFQQAA